MSMLIDGDRPCMFVMQCVYRLIPVAELFTIYSLYIQKKYFSLIFWALI